MTTQVLGELEQMVLLAVARLGEHAYAVSVRDEIHAQAGVDLSRGAIYVTLDRLEDKGLLRSRFSDPTPERGGKARRCFRLEPAGAAALRESQRALARMWAGVKLAPGRS
ncbi:MAG: PadR family transcriptional regulator [Vicinamibacteria bacterium]|nr:PadR family transcriptional regulator [Vicinamibacteria bacterium]